MSSLCHNTDKLFHRVQISAYLYNSHNHPEDRMRINNNELIFLGLLCLSIILLIGVPSTHPGFGESDLVNLSHHNSRFFAIIQYRSYGMNW
jgi:hypothetical protein